MSSNRSTPIDQAVGAMPDYTEDSDATIHEVLQSLGAGAGAPVQAQPAAAAPAPPAASVPMPMPASMPMAMQQQNMPSLLDRDAQAAALVAAIVLGIMLLPVERLVSGYVNLDAIPQSGVVVKALLAAAAFYVVTKLFL